ncbi:hypothetical protein J8M20_05910 [Pseudoalteromonas luteoviolacea]|uniref:hypothetical protein n=1 Tax=Pseudoalteromonas luteoviolacea TaxID=43657 RepID=UPI001B397AF9|nr:hypothetical protein [Pseudoalteromonas luteoviolacea]MBQ4810861.1 hypothetical protein [Pseudoalteromonas luteoviolacea]
MRLLLKCILFGVVTLLAGCATPSIDSGYKVQGDTSRGVVWGTISYEGQFADYQLHYKNNHTGETGFVKAELVKIEGAKGGIFALSLPTGSYTLTGWKVSTLYSSTSVSEVGSTFLSKGGDVNYIGRFHFSEKTQKSEAVIGLSIFDNSKHDQTLLSRMYPNIDISALVIDAGFINTAFCGSQLNEGVHCEKSIVNTPVR